MYENIDLTVTNKLHGPMHNKIGVYSVEIIHLFHNSTVLDEVLSNVIIHTSNLLSVSYL